MAEAEAGEEMPEEAGEGRLGAAAAVAGRQQEALRVRAGVDAFLLRLPLGDGPEDAAVEAAVARRLFRVEMEAHAMRRNLSQWCPPPPLLPLPPPSHPFFSSPTVAASPRACGATPTSPAPISATSAASRA